MGLFPKDNLLDPLFLYYFTHTVDIYEYSQATTVPSVRKSDIENIEFPLAPLSEQHRIVAEIEKQFTRLDAAVAALRRAKANLARYKAAVLKAAVEGRLVPQTSKTSEVSETSEVLLERILADRRAQWEAANPKKQYVEPKRPDVAGLPALPVGWVWARAEQLTYFITKGTTPSSDKLFSGTGEIPFIKVYNLTFDTTLDFRTNPTFVSRSTHVGELSRSRLLPGDVLMNIVGPPLGKVSIVPDKFPEWNMNQAITMFRPLRGIDNRYLAILLQSDPVLNWAVTRAKATAGQFNLTLEICRDLPLPIAPEIEQKRIVEEFDKQLSSIQAADQAITANLARAERLRQGVLGKAFRGELVASGQTSEVF